jgi:hypothetical protein
VMHKLIPTMRKRTTVYTKGEWFITSTTIWDKVELSSASNSRNVRTNNRENIHSYSGVVGANNSVKEDEADRRWRSANTGIEGRRRPTSSHDDTSQKPDTPLPRAGTRGDVGFGDLFSRRRWHVGGGIGKTATAQHSGKRRRWILCTEDDVSSQYIHTSCRS